MCRSEPQTVAVVRRTRVSPGARGGIGSDRGSNRSSPSQTSASAVDGAAGSLSAVRVAVPVAPEPAGWSSGLERSLIGVQLTSLGGDLSTQVGRVHSHATTISLGHLRAHSGESSVRLSMRTVSRHRPASGP
ncbi:Uncharacterised protein [Mycobacteroides abscessus subsp. abscessus]|nr:Uncharacterised protein [Mycobacteroides abscessus subsp. abscessus]